ncbi:CBS domain-containing protein [Haloimpatiens lingqiaonensis]|uniref:CBS domain-containing protein n=1 Tax=Haloimpatiens lingqiaonensis TaxID=1380675 RepID=UPI0010FDBF0A|nr:CBS domain-containing protein [Haloimpatiens lingqiaonensis]
MKVRDIMTREVATVNYEDTVERVAQLMQNHNVGSIPVCKGENVIGIVTDRDIALRAVAKGQNVMRQNVREIMSSNPVTISADSDVHEAARIMSERQIRRLPVVDGENLVGMLSIGDLAIEPKLSDNAGEALSNISEPATPEM